MTEKTKITWKQIREDLYELTEKQDDEKYRLGRYSENPYQGIIPETWKTITECYSYWKCYIKDNFFIETNYGFEEAK